MNAKFHYNTPKRASLTFRPCDKQLSLCWSILWPWHYEGYQMKANELLKRWYYTLLTWKYKVNLLNAPVSSFLRKKCAHDCNCDRQHVNAFFYCVTLVHGLLLQIISYSDTKVPVLVVMECKRASVIYVYQLTFLLHTSRSTECSHVIPNPIAMKGKVFKVVPRYYCGGVYVYNLLMLLKCPPNNKRMSLT